MATTSAQVQQLYVAYLGRAADKAGLDYWLNELNADNATLTLDDLRTNFTTQQTEYTDAYAGLSRSDTVIKIYNNLFGRAPDAAGLTYWTTGGGAAVNSDDLLSAFINGAATADANVISNKVLVAEVYTSAAGDNYAKADATSIISTVTGSASSVGTALGHLEDGTLPGIAIPTGVAALKAVAIAEQAVTDLETSQTTSLTNLNKAVITLNDTLPASQKLADSSLAITTAGTTATYDEAHVAVIHALQVRNAVSTDSSATLQANVTNANATYTDARAAFVKATVGNVDLAVNYEAAYKANAALTANDTTVVNNAEAKVQVDFTTANTGTALADANTAAGLSGSASVTDAASLYAALTNPDATSTQIQTISSAFGTFLGTAGAADYTTLKSLAATDYAKAVAADAASDATAAVTAAGGTAYENAFTAKVTADTTLANYTAADALVSQATALDNAHAASEQAAAAVTVPTYAHDLDATSPVLAGDNTKADLFYFSAIKAADDLTITNFNKGDALYIGEGYTFNSSVKVDASTGFYTGTNTSAKEVFFLQDATTKVVSAVIETNAVGHVAGTGTADNVAVITLTGVTSLSDVSYANGVITSAHVA